MANVDAHIQCKITDVMNKFMSVYMTFILLAPQEDCKLENWPK